MSDPTWQETGDFLRNFDHPTARANAGLLRTAATHWHSTVVARTSMIDLLFTIPGDGWPFPDYLTVSVERGVFVFRLYAKQVALVSGDFARDETAPLVLDSYLEQLTAVR